MADTTEEPTTLQSRESGVVDNSNNNTTPNLSETLLPDNTSQGQLVEDKTVQPSSAKDDQPSPESVPPLAQSLTTQAHIFTDKALHFLSQASNETIGACLVGLGATTYLILGRIGLVLIGLVAGIALHASWDAQGESDGAAAKETESKKKREIGLEVVQRVFKWKAEAPFVQDESEANEAETKAVVSKKKLDFSAFQPETATALGAFTDAIIRDYVKYAIPFSLLSSPVLVLSSLLSLLHLLIPSP